MNIYLCVFLALVQLSYSGPMAEQSIPDISAKVQYGIWLGGTPLKYQIVPTKGGNRGVQSENLPPHVLLILENPLGVTQENRNRLNAGFQIWLHRTMLKFPIPKPMLKGLEPGGAFLLWIMPCSDIRNIEIGKTIDLRGIVIWGNDGDLSAVCKSWSIKDVAEY